VTGSAYFTRVPIQPGQTLSSEACLLEWSPAPLAVLEHYADASKDGVNWERFADEEILPLKPKGFETKTQFYPNVIEMGDELWMFYAANVPGGTGIGLATMPKSELSSAR
jgi:hypothetical protein